MKKILVIGRHKDMLAKVQQLLQVNGYLAFGAIENEEAVNQFKKVTPDAVIIGGGVDYNSRDHFYKEFALLNPSVKIIDAHPQTVLTDLRLALEK